MALWNVTCNLSNQTTRINGSIFYSLNSKDSISVASDRNSLSSSPVGTFDFSLSRHFQVFENLFVPTSGPCPASSSSPKEPGMFFTALCWILRLRQRKAIGLSSIIMMITIPILWRPSLDYATSMLIWWIFSCSAAAWYHLPPQSSSLLNQQQL